jgi:TonB family protein
MTRLQKKCVIVTAGLHLLMLAILFLGPAFFNREPKTDNLPVLDMIPANVIDAAFNSGVKNAAPPRPQPIVAPQPPPQPQIQPQPQPQVQPQPQPQVQPSMKLVEPAPTPKPTFTSELEKFFTHEPKPESETTVHDTEQPQPHKIQVNTQLVTGQPSNTRPTTRPNHSQDNARAINNALSSLKNNLAPATKIDLSGDSSVAYANYASVVKSVYDGAWILPSSINADENIKVSITIARDGSVVSSHIVTASGDAPADDSVQRALDRVQFVAAFPDDWTQSQRTFVIVFNPQVKSSE